MLDARVNTTRSKVRLGECFQRVGHPTKRANPAEVGLSLSCWVSLPNDAASEGMVTSAVLQFGAGLGGSWTTGCHHPECARERCNAAPGGHPGTTVQ